MSSKWSSSIYPSHWSNIPTTYMWCQYNHKFVMNWIELMHIRHDTGTSQHITLLTRVFVHSFSCASFWNVYIEYVRDVTQRVNDYIYSELNWIELIHIRHDSGASNTLLYCTTHLFTKLIGGLESSCTQSKVCPSTDQWILHLHHTMLEA